MQKIKTTTAISKVKQGKGFSFFFKDVKEGPVKAKRENGYELGNV